MIEELSNTIFFFQQHGLESDIVITLVTSSSLEGLSLVQMPNNQRSGLTVSSFCMKATIASITFIITLGKRQEYEEIFEYCQQYMIASERSCFPDASWEKVNMKNWHVIQITR